MKIKHLKIRQDSQTFAFQKKIPLRLVEKARLLNLKQVVVMPLGLAVGASEVMVATAIEQKNKQFETLVRFLEQTDYTAVEKAHWESKLSLQLEFSKTKKTIKEVFSFFLREETTKLQFL